MADDLSFTISAEDQASRSIETVQKKIQGFGSDVAKLALGVVGPMALLQAGIGLVADKWNEYKQAQKDAEQAQKDAFEKGASYTLDEVKAQESLGQKLDKNLSIILAIAKVKKDDAKTTKEIFDQENALIEEYLKSTEAQGVTTGGNTYQESSDYQNQFIRNIQNASRDDKLTAAKAWAEKKAQEFYAKKYGPNSTPESRASQDAFEKESEEKAKKTAIANTPEKISAVNEKIKQAQKNLENGGALTGEKLIEELKQKVRYAQDEYDTIQEGQASEIDNANALLKLEEAKIALRDEQNKQTEEEKKNQAELAAQKAKDEALYKSSGKLTVSSLREIGGSFGGGDVSSSINTQIQLAQQTVNVLNTIAQNTTPKSDVGESKPIGNTNFTTSEGIAMYGAQLYLKQ